MNELALLGEAEIGPRATLNARALEAIARAYGFADARGYEDLGGTYNLNARIHMTSGDYVLRVLRPWVTRARLAQVQSTRLALANAGLPVPTPVPGRDGATMLRVDGRLVEVDAFVAHDATADTWERTAAAFAMLGRLHGALRDAAPSPLIEPRVSNYATPSQLLRWLAETRAALRDQPASEARDAALSLCNDADELAHAYADWRAAVTALPMQPIHGDYGGGNVLFRGGAIVAILDFDFLGVRERVYELAYSLYWALIRLEPDTDPQQWPWNRVGDVLRRYDEAAMRTGSLPLSGDERMALPREMARVPLYWLAEASFLPEPVQTVNALARHVPIAQALFAHARESA